jgi:hypothetical protein
VKGLSSNSSTTKKKKTSHQGHRCYISHKKINFKIFKFYKETNTSFMEEVHKMLSNECNNFYIKFQRLTYKKMSKRF